MCLQSLDLTFDYSLLWKVGGALFILLGLSLLWNHKLNQLRNHFAEQVQVQTGELRQSKEMLHSIVELTPDIIYRLDPVGRVVFVNQAIEKYGYRPEEIVGQNTDISVNGVMGSEHILFVDDETVQRDIATQGLKKLGYQVTTAADGESALVLFEKNPDFYNVVISDITMPGLSGDVLARRLLQLKPDLPIILCTGFSERTNEHSAKAMGVGAYVYKPLAILELAGKIRELCSAETRA